MNLETGNFEKKTENSRKAYSLYEHETDSNEAVLRYLQAEKGMGEKKKNKFDVLSINFNQLNDCFSVATVNGFSVFTTEPFAENVGQPKIKNKKNPPRSPTLCHRPSLTHAFLPTRQLALLTVSKRILQWRYIHLPNALQEQHSCPRRWRPHPSLPPNQGDDLGRRTRTSNWRTRLQNPRQISVPQARQNSSSA